MTGLRGFGMSMQVGGPVRHWYVGSDGIRRWSDTDKPVDEFQAAMSAGIPPIGTPDPIDAHETECGMVAGEESIYHDNDCIEEIAAAVAHAEIIYGAHDDDRR